jgi:uncharacterized membrane protein YoaK (UPF0700 family)
MLIREGDSRTIDIDVRLALPLAAVAGAVNAAAFRAVGFFSANMTGNVSSFSDYAAVRDWPAAATFLILLVAFVLGAFVSTFLIQLARNRGVAAVFAYSIAVEGFLLGLVGLANIVSPAFEGSLVSVASLAFLMGLQNAATTLISNARVRTTHVSGMVTDIGIELAMLAGQRQPSPERSAVGARLRLHGVTLLAFIAGGIAGVMVYTVAGSWVFELAAGTLLAVTLPYLPRVRK